MAVTRLVAPGPLVPMQTPALPVDAGVALGGETAALLVAGQDGADLGAGERLVKLHARAARVGEDHLDAFPFEGFDEDVAAELEAGAAGAGATFPAGAVLRLRADLDLLLIDVSGVGPDGSRRTKNPRPEPAVGWDCEPGHSPPKPSAGPVTRTSAFGDLGCVRTNIVAQGTEAPRGWSRARKPGPGTPSRWGGGPGRRVVCQDAGAAPSCPP
jgi:hypothetical protein